MEFFNTNNRKFIGKISYNKNHNLYYHNDGNYYKYFSHILFTCYIDKNILQNTINKLNHMKTWTNDMKENLAFYIVKNMCISLDLIKVLIENDVNIHQLNCKNQNIFFELLKNEYLQEDIIDILKLLIDHGLNINHIDRYGNNILFYLVESYMEPYDIIYILEFLISINININQINNDGENILFHISNKLLTYNNYEIISLLINNGININQINNYDENILFKYSYYNISIDFINRLIEYGIDIHKIAKNNKNILYHICKSEYLTYEILYNLIKEKNININISIPYNIGNFNILFEISNNKRITYDILKLLINSIDKNIININEIGGTFLNNILFNIIENESITCDILKLLIDNGININQLDYKGRNILDYIRYKESNVKIINMLLNSMDKSIITTENINNYKNLLINIKKLDLEKNINDIIIIYKL